MSAKHWADGLRRNDLIDEIERLRAEKAELVDLLRELLAQHEDEDSAVAEWAQAAIAKAEKP